MKIRRSKERGHADHGWLQTFHTFSFADYYDRAHMGYRALRVINEDRVAPARGFGKHPHQDMEIVTYVLAGALEHKDSMGNGSVIRPGDVQRMSAGTGVFHSEMNPSPTDAVHLLQIWILPDKRGYPPGYEQKAFSREEREGGLRLIASRDGRDGSVSLHQDVSLYASILASGSEIQQGFEPSRHLWIHVARGDVEIDGQALSTGDAAAIDAPGTVRIEGTAPESEILLFDLA